MCEPWLLPVLTGSAHLWQIEILCQRSMSVTQKTGWNFYHLLMGLVESILMSSIPLNPIHALLASNLTDYLLQILVLQLAALICPQTVILTSNVQPQIGGEASEARRLGRNWFILLCVPTIWKQGETNCILGLTVYLNMLWDNKQE